MSDKLRKSRRRPRGRRTAQGTARRTVRRTTQRTTQGKAKRTTRRTNRRRRRRTLNKRKDISGDGEVSNVRQMGGGWFLNRNLPQLGFNYCKHLLACGNSWTRRPPIWPCSKSLQSFVPQVVVPILTQSASTMAPTTNFSVEDDAVLMKSTDTFSVNCPLVDAVPQAYSDSVRAFSAAPPAAAAPGRRGATYSMWRVDFTNDGLFDGASAGAENLISQMEGVTGEALFTWLKAKTEHGANMDIYQKALLGTFEDLRPHFDKFISLLGATPVIPLLEGLVSLPPPPRM